MELLAAFGVGVVMFLGTFSESNKGRIRPQRGHREYPKMSFRGCGDGYRVVEQNHMILGKL